MKKLVFLLIPVIVFYSCNTHSGKIYKTSEGAIDGYDPVAYFSEQKPVKGDKKFVTQWKDVDWYFSSDRNLKTFMSNPEAYAPQYGGYCAFGTAEGHKVPTQPDAWKIVDNKLYLNYNRNVQAMWLKDQTRLILKADSNWSSVKHMD